MSGRGDRRAALVEVHAAALWETRHQQAQKVWGEVVGKPDAYDRPWFKEKCDLLRQQRRRSAGMSGGSSLHLLTKRLGGRAQRPQSAKIRRCNFNPARRASLVERGGLELVTPRSRRPVRSIRTSDRGNPWVQPHVVLWVAAALIVMSSLLAAVGSCPCRATYSFSSIGPVAATRHERSKVRRSRNPPIGTVFARKKALHDQGAIQRAMHARGGELEVGQIRALRAPPASCRAHNTETLARLRPNGESPRWL